ncbi:MAG: IPT/TIG domain-containing protein [Gammaproteobacteria bacterium]|nr:IPT/TIG domain-containing protein [Gammaproteobacteria bacterium]
MIHRIFNRGNLLRISLIGLFTLPLSACGGGGGGDGGGDNPVPTANSVTPNAMQASSADFVITVTGGDFADGAEVRWNGAARTTSLVAASSDRATASALATELRATITAADIANPGTAQVTVFNPGPGGGESAALPFTITNPTPVAGELAPSNAAVGGPSFTLAVTGSQFMDGAVVRWDGADLITTFVSGGELQAAIGAADIGALGTAEVTVFNPAPGGGTSDPLTFSIVDPPTLVELLPDTALRGSGGLLLTVNGTNFIDGAVINWNGSPRTTTFNSDAQLEADITAADINVGGFVTVTATNPGAAGGTSNDLIFAVDNPVPTAASIDPVSRTLGTPGDFVLTVNGTNFVDGATVRWNGASRTTTFVSDTVVTATIRAADIDVAVSATRDITVVNPVPGGGASNVLTFTIDNPVPAVPANGLSPTTAALGNGFTLTVTGSNFVTGARINWNGTPQTTTVDSYTRLRATIGAGLVSPAGPVNITVTNPTPGGGTSAPARILTINNPQPTVASFLPTAAVVGSGPFPLTVTGTGFVTGAQLLWNGFVRNTTVNSPTELVADIEGNDILVLGSIPIVIRNPAPAMGDSAPANYDVVNPTPAIISIFPRDVAAGSTGVNLTLTGSGFLPGSVVRVNGFQFTPPPGNNGTTLTVTVPNSETLAAGTVTVSVASVGGLSNTETLFVLNPGQTFFYDNFNRPNSTIIGNGWTEKFNSTDSFAITDNEVIGPPGTLLYFNKTVVRPDTEDVADVELSMEFTRRPVGARGGFPQIHARIDRATVFDTGFLGSYIFYVEDFEFATARIAVQPIAEDSFECMLADVPLFNPLVEGNRYRLRFRVTGGAPAAPPVLEVPVTLQGSIDALDAFGGWQEINSVTTTHRTGQPPIDGLFCIQDNPRPTEMPPPYFGPGATGFAKWSSETERLDNFYWITPPSP